MRHQKKKWSLCCFVLIWCGHLTGQVISGMVMDKQIKEPLIFAHIRINQTTKGATTDLDGRFQLEAHHGDTLHITYLGYMPSRFIITNVNELLQIELTPHPAQLQEIEVKPRENPAWRVIRQALLMREKHNPELYQNYNYTSYNKSVFHISSLKAGTGTRLNQVDLDSLPEEKSSIFKDAYFWLKESIVQTNRTPPNLLKEEVIASKSSMPNDLLGGLEPTNFHPLGFYQEVIYFNLLGKSYLNPLSRGCFDRYDFRLEEVIPRVSDTTFVISFRPLPKRNFLGFSGSLAINSSDYAIENVSAVTADSSDIIHVKLQQQSQRIKTKWFPTVMQTELKCMLEDGSEGYNLLWVRNRSFLSNIIIDSSITRNSFSYLNRIELSTLNTDSIWQHYRKEPLSSNEVKTYAIWDTATSIRHLRTIFKIYNKNILRPLITGKIVDGPLEFLIQDFLKINRYEKLRIGIGVQTHLGASQNFSLGGHIGYGLGDRAFKYGAFTTLQVSPQSGLKLKLSYKQDLEEPGSPSLLSNTTPGIGTWIQPRNVYRYRFDSVQVWRTELFWHPRQGWNINPFFYQERREMMAYQNLPELTAKAYHVQVFGVNLRWAPHEKWGKFNGTEALFNQSFPIVDVQFSHFQLSQPSVNSFSRFHVNLDHRILFKGLGITRIRLGIGRILGEAPYPYLFNLPGSFVEDRSTVLMPRTFQTAGLYEFTGAQFLAFFGEHQFPERFINIRSPYFQPRLSIYQNVGYSQLKSSQYPLNIPYQTMENIFLESGISIRDFIRIPLKSTGGYLTGTLGSFLRWGNYQKPDFKDNLVHRFAIGYAPMAYNSYKKKIKKID